ncbi:unnamed protein product [Rhizoctonia solani]|uniref:F-box domain-containing protein n=1 Tax=Rhizoctonia solani TaxID=456999 RepID=A0A8H3HXM0_9AGAM|nr:unnamed protein product [Rhizoctonia solani]
MPFTTATPLPPLGNLFEVAQPIRVAYLRILPLEANHAVHIRVLGWMLIHAPNEAGRADVARTINQCETDPDIIAAGQCYLQYFVKYFQGISNQPTPTLSNHPSRPSMDTLRDEILNTIEQVPTSHSNAKDRALVRDNYRCQLTGGVDLESYMSSPQLQAEYDANPNLHVGSTFTQCTHILPQYIGHYIGADECVNSAAIWSIVQAFGGIPPDEVNAEGIHHLRNIMTLRGESSVQRSHPGVLSPMLPPTVTLTSNTELPLPDRRYLALHAACAKNCDIMHVQQEIAPDDDDHVGVAEQWAALGPIQVIRYIYVPMPYLTDSHSTATPEPLNISTRLMSSLDQLPRMAMKQWEEAGVSLLEAFRHYTDMSTRLGTKVLDKEIAPVELASKVESTLEKVHTVILDQLPKIASDLRKSRNALISSTSRFPNEVLLKIFGDVVFDYHSLDGEAPLPVKQSLQLSFARLYTLCSVCSTWRDIAVANGTLWSVIPLIVHQSTWELKPYQPSLERAGASQLALAAVIDSSKARILLNELLSKYVSRFRTINLSVDRIKPRIVHEVVKWLSNDDVGSLSELSIRLQDGLPIVVTRAWDGDSDRSQSPLFHRGGIYEPRLPSEHDYIFPRDSPQEVSFNKLLKSLTAFRISSVQIYWDNIAFSSRLVELLIHDVNFGYDDELAPFLQTLSSASELRDLKITSFQTFYRTGTSGANFPAISFPKLRSLFLGGLYFNTLKRILSMITPGSYLLTLCLDDQSWEVMRMRRVRDYADPQPDGYDDTGYTYVEGQWASFGPIQVDTLLIQCGGLLRSPQLRAILGAIQGLKTLKIDNWYAYYREELSISSREPDGTQSSLEELLPAVECLHFTRAMIKDSDIPALKEMAAIHTLQEILLGGKVDFSDDPQRLSYCSFQEHSHLVEWLRKELPHARLVDEKYRSADVHSGWWQMW